MKGFRLNIRRKIILAIYSAVFITVVSGLSLGYFWGFNLLRNSIGRERVEKARFIAFTAVDMINAKIEQLKTFSEEWAGAETGVKEILNNDESLSEIIITDVSGKLVAASAKITDSGLAEKNWWQAAFAEGKGRVFIGDVVFDKSTGAGSITIAFPLKDQAGKITGILKAVVSSEKLFRPLENLKSQKGERFILVNERGDTVFYSEAGGSKESFVSEDNFQKLLLLMNESGWEIMRGLHGEDKSFVAFVRVDQPFLLENKMLWKAFLEEDTREVFAPLKELILQWIIVTAIVIMIMVPLGIVISAVLTRPIEELNRATKEIGKGNLDYKIEVKSGDEIEGLADSFKEMVEKIKEKEMQILWAKMYVESIVSSMADAVIVLDTDGDTIKHVNKATEELLGYSQEELIGKVISLLLKEGYVVFKDKMLKLIMEVGSMRYPDFTVVSKDGERIPVSFSGSMMYEESAAGKIIGIVCVIRDMRQVRKLIANLERTKAALEEALRIKSDFTSMVSHELRTPLTAIKEGVGIVLDGSAGAVNEQQQDFLQTAKRNVDRLARLINDVLDFQKLESGKVVFDLQENNINELVKDVRETMLSLVEKKELDFQLLLDENIPLVKFDRDKITQVLMNVVNNAIKFTDSGGIIITTSRGENFIQVSVKDTGPGIKEEDMPKLFRQFEQLGKGIERKTGGTGLGLAISKEIIDKHNGKLWAESKINEGTVFYIILPIKERRAV